MGHPRPSRRVHRLRRGAGHPPQADRGWRVAGSRGDVHFLGGWPARDAARRRAERQGAGLVPGGGWLCPPARDPAQLAGALIGQGIAQWGIPDRPGAFTGFDEALGILRKLIAAGGLQAHGATFISWVGWPARDAARRRAERQGAGLVPGGGWLCPPARRPGAAGGALIGQGIAQWGIPDRPGAFTGFDEALGILRKLIAAHGPAGDGATFAAWVRWPVGEMLREDGQQAKADALDQEAKAYDPST